MCGIAGIISRREMSPKAALDAIAHRGPDAEGEYRQGTVWLGHRRLSIIDLSAGGAQPMVKAGAGAIVFNGEIYDHRRHRAVLEGRGLALDSSSDTEVLLRGLATEGTSFLRGVHGMYAFAWLEPAGERLLLGRDHAGMKPLYYWKAGGDFAFASEVRSLARAIDLLGGKTRLSGRALASFLSWGAVQEPDCILEGVGVVPAGCVLEVRLATGEVRCQAVALAAREDVGDREAQAVEAIRSAVERHLESDVPVAIFLSSGLDSGVLAAEAMRLAGRAPTAISVELGSRGTSDEPELVQRFAARLGMRLEKIALDDWPDRLARAVQAYDQPSIDGLNTFLVAASARQLGFKVALSGVGADEIFGGYSHLRSPVPDLRRIFGARLLARGLGARLEGATSQKARRVGALLEGVLRDEPPARSWRRMLSDRAIRALLPWVPLPGWEALPDDPLAIERGTYLVNTLLRDTDVMGMAHGVEIRAPYLDPDVIQAARSLGTGALLDPRRASKWILRENWNAFFEPRGLRRKKTGFSLDLGAWLRSGSGRELLELARARLPLRHAVSKPEAQTMFDRELLRLGAGQSSAAHSLFALIQLDIQFERWGEPA